MNDSCTQTAGNLCKFFYETEWKMEHVLTFFEKIQQLKENEVESGTCNEPGTMILLNSKLEAELGTIT